MSQDTDDIYARLEKDDQGRVRLRPIMGFAVGPAADIAVLLALQYIENPGEFETGGQVIGFLATPHQCLEIAEALTRRAKQLLDPPKSERRSN